MSYTCFDLAILDRIAHLTMKRPEKRNSMIPEFWDELPEIIHDIDRNAKARVIVISSTGPHFSAGLDLNAFVTGNREDPDDPDAKIKAKRLYGINFYQNILRMQGAFNCLEECRIPVIAAVQGGVIGGAVDFVSACDMRYAAKGAFFTIMETNVAMTADAGTFPRLVKLMPEGIVRELSYTGRAMPAEEARSYGFVNQVFSDPETMIGEVMKIAGEIASKAPLAVYGCKRMINYARDHNTADGLDYIGIWNSSMLQPDEMFEAVMAKSQKRPGKFVDLPKVKLSFREKE
jgi:enoyl-CoA hydratase